MRAILVSLLFVPTLAFADGDTKPADPPPAPVVKILADSPAKPGTIPVLDGKQCETNDLGQVECKASPRT